MREPIHINDAQRIVLLIGLTLSAILFAVVLQAGALGALLMVLLWTAGATGLYAGWQAPDPWRNS